MAYLKIVGTLFPVLFLLGCGQKAPYACDSQEATDLVMDILDEKSQEYHYKYTDFKLFNITETTLTKDERSCKARVSYRNILLIRAPYTATITYDIINGVEKGEYQVIINDFDTIGS
ncbi:hypothetical protein V5030_09145 [Moellerella wisconsensis]|uniref:hypothetical protein n=1 Tax=Moellerella wisconsensis TaxID=158849 RepID=UPI00307654A0